MCTSSQEHGNPDTAQKSSLEWRQPSKPSEHEISHSPSQSVGHDFLTSHLDLLCLAVANKQTNLHPSQKFKLRNVLLLVLMPDQLCRALHKRDSLSWHPAAALAAHTPSQAGIWRWEPSTAGARVAVCTYTSVGSSLWREAEGEICFLQN